MWYVITLRCGPNSANFRLVVSSQKFSKLKVNPYGRHPYPTLTHARSQAISSFSYFAISSFRVLNKPVRNICPPFGTDIFYRDCLPCACLFH